MTDEINSEKLDGQVEKIFSVGEYIEAVNIALAKFRVKITGEVTSIKFGPSGHCYFTIKDSGENDGASEAGTVDCIVWKYDYQICGVEIVEGLEVILSGWGRIYQVNGRFSFVAKTVELKGEGALKRAYEKLKAKLEKEGLFDVANKKPLPDFARKIGVITSKQGAVIHDLLNNLGKFGYKIKMVDSRVEGQEAVADLLNGLKIFAKQEIDVLIIMRGGGSLESLQAFNNENIVRAIFDFKAPLISAIGHDKDVPLAGLASDYNCSTPTAAANIINKSWEMAPLQIQRQERIIFERFSLVFSKAQNILDKNFKNIVAYLENILSQSKELENQIYLFLQKIENSVLAYKKDLSLRLKDILTNFDLNIRDVLRQVDFLAKNIGASDPQKNLKLGYCIARKNNKVIKKIEDFKKNENFDLQTQNGIVNSKVEKVLKT